MVSLLSKTLLVLLVSSLLLITGCSTKYVCYDGSVEKDESKCPVVPVPTVVQRQAETAVDTYASAYASAIGARHSRVNTYRVEGDWHSEILFTNVRTGTVNPVTLKINGRTSSVSCIEGCDYLFRDDIEVLNESQGVDSDFSVY